MKRFAAPLGLALLMSWSVNTVARNNDNGQDQLPLEDLQRFTSVVEHIRKYYVEPVDDKTLFEYAIRGMLTGLDPHSAYLDPSEFSDLRVSTTGKFGGLGIEVTMEQGAVRVISPIDDTPATKAGIKAGDLIIRLDDTPVKGLTLKDAVELMRGERGTDILLTVIREGEAAPLKINVTRDIIRVRSVKSKILDKDYGYIRISQFQTKTGQDLIDNINKLQNDNNIKLKGIVLDLRNNPGGILEASVKVSDAFLDKPNTHKGRIVYTEGRLPGSKMEERAHGGDILNGAPIVVLVNSGSASASEIVAGALQDHRRALIVGQPTFGKGSVQTVLPLQSNHGLKLTTALYFTPSGRSIQAKGIDPDIKIPELTIPKATDSNDWNKFKERDLQGHIETPKNSKNKKPQAKNSKPAEDDVPLYVSDYQLNEALILLKGLALTRSEFSLEPAKFAQR
jgi:carboxyl-terminal processing protease